MMTSGSAFFSPIPLSCPERTPRRRLSEAVDRAKEPVLASKLLVIPLSGRGEMSTKYAELTFKFTLMVLCVIGLLYGNSRSERLFSILTRPPTPTVEKDEVEETLADLHAPRERLSSLNGWIRAASRATSLDPILLCCLFHTESHFKKEAVSEKGYMGEAQTRRFSQYSSVNILEGAETLRDKLGLSRGDIFEALARYKGGKDKKDAQQQAREVLKLYHSELKKREIGKPTKEAAVATALASTRPPR